MSHAAETEARFATWLAEYGGIIHKITRAYAVRDVDQAELLQEIRLQLWRSLPAFRAEAKVSTWIYRVSLNTAMTWRRDAAARTRWIEPDADVTHVPTGAATPAETADQAEVVARLYAAIHAMADFDRALVLLLLDGLAYREIAEVTGLTENHVGVALTRARKRLTELLKGISHELA